ncbi:MAG: HD domain-containing protein [Firmicutes bacterium]|nr:HD domain-containing protein [Bacillota bacterium]
MSKLYEIRDPVHGFIQFSDWEREIINHPSFQRLRRIRQLGLTEMVYPGAVHTRFEHSIGVMYVATKMFDQILKRQKKYLVKLLNYNDDDFAKARTVVRLAALLHDIGHSPFSHAGEGLLPQKRDTELYKHEDYSAAITEFVLADVIDNHPLNQYGLKAKTVADFFKGIPALGRELLIWRSIITGQIDADRADYLLRDSHHIGVAYGRFDLDRILVTMNIKTDPETEAPILVVNESGGHAVEGLILARYMMFTQVYFQHTRRIFDYHITELMKFLLKRNRCKNKNRSSVFPTPVNKKNVQFYLGWCDSRVWGLLTHGKGGDHGSRILKRDHYRRVHETPEIPDESDLQIAEELFDTYKKCGACLDSAEQSWYKLGDDDIPILTKDDEIIPLSQWSNLIVGLKPINQVRVYVDSEIWEEAKLYRDKLLGTSWRGD